MNRLRTAREVDMPSKRKTRLLRSLLGAAILVSILVPAGSPGAEPPFRRYTFHGGGVVPGRFEILAFASGGRQDHPVLFELDPVGCYTDKNLLRGIFESIPGLPQSNPHEGGFCRHIGYGFIIVRQGTEILRVTQQCMKFQNGVLGFAGRDNMGRRTYVKLVDKPTGDKAGFSRTGGTVQGGVLCGAANVPTYRLTGNGFVSTDTGSFG
jgi:hypothetical protein